MSMRRLIQQFHYGRTVISKALAAIAFIAASSMFASGQAAEVLTIKSTGAAASGLGFFSATCRTDGTVFISVTANATHSKGSGTPVTSLAFAEVYMSWWDDCTQAYSYALYAGDVQFSFKDGGGSRPPKSATASGQIPSVDGSDFVTIQMALTAAGTPFETDTKQTTRYQGFTQKISLDEAGVPATGTFSVSTPSFGIDIQNFSAHLGNTRSSYTTITK
ncbi:hypothetical protein AWB81_01864 [Caballeronia arationis]|uniref:hypothetical protein n=1 Tax=Caballeronia arationis TaxID=1777142 RepID=UPI00074BC8A9|nr:hypothetical protein [Caballeronia arationis]SAK59575.1 hypothetical protein AWB81_01864 [Caballeronia arationis]